MVRHFKIAPLFYIVHFRSFALLASPQTVEQNVLVRFSDEHVLPIYDHQSHKMAAELVAYLVSFGFVSAHKLTPKQQ